MTLLTYITRPFIFISGDIRLDLPRALDVKELLTEKAAFITGIYIIS